MQFPVQKLSAFAKHYNVPEYVKTAGTHVFDDLADPRTKAACYLSKFAALYGLPTLSDSERQKRAAILQVDQDLARLEKEYHQFENGGPERDKAANTTEKYPIRNRGEFAAAVSWLHKNAHCLSQPERRDLARKLQDHSSQYGVKLPETFEKWAGSGLPDLEVLVDNLLKRAELVKTARQHTRQQRNKTASELTDLAEAVKYQPRTAREPAMLDKLAAVMQFIDGEFGLTGHYGEFIHDPDRAVRPISEKIGDEITKYARELPGGVYDLRDFKDIKLAEVMETLGPDYVEAIADGLEVNVDKVATVLDVMTELETALFEDIIKTSGIKPRLQSPKYVKLSDFR